VLIALAAKQECCVYALVNIVVLCWVICCRKLAGPLAFDDVLLPCAGVVLASWSKLCFWSCCHGSTIRELPLTGVAHVIPDS
jgi:hypothetical protein